MIEVENLSYTYPGNAQPTVRHINFAIGSGEIFGFLGPSGAGKSTTQKILTRLLRHYQGQIHIAGKSLSAWDSDFYNHIGVGFELPNHYAKLTAIENLKFFATFFDKEVIPPTELLDWVGLQEEGDKKTESFSKGMKMRLNFIRALMHRPEILFLDEPTSGLDPANARILKNIILDQKAKGTTIFLTTHNMHDAEELCDRVAFMVEGELKVMDTPRNLKLQHGTRVVEVDYGKDVPHSRVFPMDTLGSNPDFLELLQKEYVQSIHSKEARLDDLFIQLTGTRLN